MIVIIVLIISVCFFIILKKKKPVNDNNDFEVKDIINEKSNSTEKIASFNSDVYLKKVIGKNKPINSSKRIFNEFVAIDTETTGLNPSNDFIIEIAAIKFKDGKITDSYETLINPDISIPAHITKINHIDNSMISSSPNIKVVLPELLNFIEDLPLVAHNASFDINFINANLALIDNSLKNPVIDTLAISRTLFPNLKNHKLDTIREYLNIITNDSHRASPDCVACAKIYLTYCEHKKLSKQKVLDKPYKQMTIPTDSVDRNLQGIKLEKQGFIDNAVELYELNIKENFDGTHPYDRLAIIYRRRKQYKNEIRIIEKAISIFSEKYKRYPRETMEKELYKLNNRLKKATVLSNK